MCNDWYGVMLVGDVMVVTKKDVITKMLAVVNVRRVC